MAESFVGPFGFDTVVVFFLTRRFMAENFGMFVGVVCDTVVVVVIVVVIVVFIEVGAPLFRGVSFVVWPRPSLTFEMRPETLPLIPFVFGVFVVQLVFE